jgi:hypothetical protein
VVAPCAAVLATANVRPVVHDARMAQFLSVREARREFAQVLNAAAYQERRTVIVRRDEVAGAFVSPEDLIFLLRYRPSADSGPAQKALDEDRAELEWRALQLASREEVARRYGSSEDERARLATDREKLAADRRLFDAMVALQGPKRAAQRAPS